MRRYSDLTFEDEFLNPHVVGRGCVETRLDAFFGFGRVEALPAMVAMSHTLRVTLS